LTQHATITLVAIAVVLSTALSGCEEGPPPTTAPRSDLTPTSADITLANMAPEASYGTVSRGQESIRRLTREQFVRAIHDLFGPDIVVPRVAEPDVTRGGLRAIGASSLTYSPRGVESVETAAFEIAAQVLDSPAGQEKLVPCMPTGSTDETCARTVLADVAARAWRRPVSQGEVDGLVALANSAGEVLDDFYEGLAYGVAAILQSPYFLFRIEVGAEESGAERRLSDHQLAARLSFFLWNSPPDAILREAAASGQLKTREGLFGQAIRLLNDPQARTGLRALFNDYLRLYELDHLTKDPTVFEHFNDKLGTHAREETLRLIEDLIFDVPRDFRELMTSQVTFINPMLAAIYQVPAPEPDGFARVRLPDELGRAGLMGHVSFLAVHAHSRASSATRRGVAVRTILLCQEIPSPPVDVDTSIPEPSAEVQTLRERVASHLESPSCAGCHQLTDPIGLGLENFDGIGRYRETEYNAQIDPSGTLDGVDFADAVELGQAIREHEYFVPCVVKVLSRYAVGRMESREEGEWIDILVNRFQEHEYKLKPLILELIMSPIFRNVGALKEAQ